MGIAQNDMTGVASEEIVTAITQRLQVAEEMFAQGRGADDIVSFIYWPEIVGIIEGVATVFRGVDMLLPFAREFVPSLGRNVTIKMTDPIISSGDIASSHVQIAAENEDGSGGVYHALYIWQRRDDDWKIVHEMVCSAVAEE
nr:hypothetical protein [Sphingomonas sp. CDS-1]